MKRKLNIIAGALMMRKVYFQYSMFKAALKQRVYQLRQQ